MTRRLLAVAALALAATAAPAAAQQTASVNVSATVLTPVTVTAAPLAFGNVFPGVAKTINTTDASGYGTLTIAGEANANITIALTVPTTLAIGATTTTMPAAFTACHGAAGTTTCTPAALAAGTIPANLGASAGYWMRIGGTVTPAANQTAGAYAGSIVATVAYTGL